MQVRFTAITLSLVAIVALMDTPAAVARSGGPWVGDGKQISICTQSAPNVPPECVLDASGYDACNPAVLRVAAEPMCGGVPGDDGAFGPLCERVWIRGCAFAESSCNGAFACTDGQLQLFGASCTVRTECAKVDTHVDIGL